MRKSLIALAGAAGLATLAASGLQAQSGAAPDATSVAAVESGTYAADPNHSMVGWRISHLGFNDYFGIFGNVAGTLNLDAANLANSTVDVTIPINTVSVPSAGLRDHLLRPGSDGGQPDFFGPDPAPARFVSTAIHPTGATTGHIMGNLTMNGQTHPVTIEAELAGLGTSRAGKKTLGFHGTTTIKRSDFGVRFGIPAIPDEVPLEITVAFEKQ